MTRRDWLVLLLGFNGEGSSSPHLDPIRLQKGMFLVAMEAGLPAEQTYPFMPHNWGPYSRELRADVCTLVMEGYVQADDVPGYTWKRYALTTAGLDLARHILNDTPGDVPRKVAEIKKRVSSSGFTGLLNDVYAAYPAYAVNSLFRT